MEHQCTRSNFSATAIPINTPKPIIATNTKENIVVINFNRNSEENKNFNTNHPVAMQTIKKNSIAVS
jgi:hypothetical protein